ncbi:unnamed protein product, partial [Litomosoides sigmodontis]
NVDAIKVESLASSGTGLRNATFNVQIEDSCMVDENKQYVYGPICNKYTYMCNVSFPCTTGRVRRPLR